jgi:acetyltransferase-like isoleucine patch superfamily enzyme
MAGGASSRLPGDPVVIGERCMIFNQVVIYEGVDIAPDCVVEDRVRIGYACRIGARARLLYGAYICDRVSVGCDARVSGFACDGAVIGDRSTMMGQMVHEYTRPHEPWWDVDEGSPCVETDSVIGFGSLVIGQSSSESPWPRWRDCSPGMLLLLDRPTGRAGSLRLQPDTDDPAARAAACVNRQLG